MIEFIVACATAAWLGIFTSISPCPLTTNIAAISFISKRISRTSTVLWAGLLYTLGRAVTYMALAMLMVWGLLSTPGVSEFVQNQMNKILGPLLIVVGMLLLELIRLNFSLSVQAGSKKLQASAEKWPLAGAGLLGVLFALSMCPVSAAIFFLTLIPLAAKHGSAVLVPLVFGVGTALPVLVFAVILAVSAHKVGGAFQRLQQFEKWARRITGVVFILAGVYYCLAYIFEIPWLQGSP